MARGKKAEKMLTLEEKLERALVPVEEQPLSIPENWCWIRLGSISTNQYGYTAKAVVDNLLPKMLRITDIQEGGVDWVQVPNCMISDEDLDKYLLKNNDIVIARIGATTGKSYLLANPKNTVFASYLIRLRFKDILTPLYVYDFLQSDMYWKQISELSSGIALPGVNSSKLQTMMFPLAPCAEQQRIVDRIESLFAKLDQAKEKAQVVVDVFELRKSAILHKAFTGELTEQWRKAHGVEFSSWYKTTIGELTDIVSSKRIYKEEYVEDGIPFFRSSEVVDLYDLGFAKPIYFITEERYMQIKEQYGLPQKGDLLVTSVGTIGKTWIVDDRKFYYKDGNLTQVKQCQNLEIQFLQYYIMSSEFSRQINDTVAGSAYNALTIVKFKKIGLLLPMIDEQREIVQILDNLLGKEQQAKAAAESVLDQIDTMKKAILARAFRGELGTNEPTEESAVELLKTVL